MTEEMAIVNKLLSSILPKIFKFNKLTKLMKKRSIQQVWYFSTSMGSMNIFSWYKNFEKYKKLPSGKFVKKKEHFAKYFAISRVLNLLNFFTCSYFY